MTKKWQKPLKICLFLAIFAVLFAFITGFFQPAWYSGNYYSSEGFYKDPKNRIETVFIGASVTASGLNPMVLYEEFGICSYNLSSVAQPLETSYYWAQEAYRLHKDTLKNIVFDVSELRGEKRDSFAHNAIDPMHFSPVKIKAAFDYADNDFSKAMNYLVTLNAYHSRWTEITEEDFTKHTVDPITGTRGNNFVVSKYALKDGYNKVYLKGVVLDVGAEPEPLVESSVEAFRKLVAFCKEKNLNLILIKTPSDGWGSALHNAAAPLAEEYGLDFFDFNFEPYYNELDLLYGFDMLDGFHLNYYGATKLTRWLGEYLVNECGASDIRNDPDYEYMAHQQDIYEQTVKIRAHLSECEDICSYIETAAVDGNTVFLTVKSDAAKCLTDSQREKLRSMGLTKLSEIEENNFYLAVIENGTVTEEQLSGGEEAQNLKYSGTMENGVRYTLFSGLGEDEKAFVSCKTDNVERAKNTTGINVNIYNTRYERAVAADVFDTSKESDRDVYTFEHAALIRDESNFEKYADDEIFNFLVDFDKRQTDRNYKMHEDFAKKNNDIFYYIDKYNSEDNVIFIAAQDEASTCLTDEIREKFKEFGLPELQLLQFREAYVAVIDGGKTVYEERKGADEAILYEDGIFRVESAGFEAGNIASVKINGEECANRLRGLNLVVYSKSENTVLFSTRFDTYSLPILTEK